MAPSKRVIPAGPCGGQAGVPEPRRGKQAGIKAGKSSCFQTRERKHPLELLEAHQKVTIKIALFFVDHSSVGGGVQTMLRALTAELKAMDWIVHMAFAKGDRAWLEYEVEKVHLFDSRKTIFSLFRLALTIRRVRPSIIVSNYAEPTAIAYLASRFSFPRPPIIAVVHSHLTSQLANFGFLGRLMRRLAISCVFPRLDKIVTVSESVEQDLRRHYLLRASDQILTIRNFFDKSVHQKSKENDALCREYEGRDFFIVIGRLEREKRIDHAIKAYARIAHSCNWDLLIIGDGKLRQELKELAVASGVSQRVHFLGFMTNPFPILLLSKILLNTSIYEGLAMVIIEALALGIPVIAYDCPGGNRETLDDGRTGVLIPDGDVEALSSSMLELATDQELRFRMSRESSERAKMFDVQEAARKYDEVLKQALASGER